MKLHFDERKMVLIWTHYIENDDPDDNEGGDIEVEDTFPAKFEVCHRCGGHGRHVHEGIDGDGFTASEWEEEGPEFQEDYMSGFYDVSCTVCHGRNVTPEIDEDCADKTLLKAYYDEVDEEALYESICAAERRFGC